MSASLTDTMWDSVAAVPELRPDALSKTHCGDWKLLRKLGAGEFAQVQGCQRRGDSTIYACKHIDKSALSRSTHDASEQLYFVVLVVPVFKLPMLQRCWNDGPK